MTNSVVSLMLDSSVLVEYAKKRRTELLDYLINQSGVSLYINSIVLSEYTFHWLADKGKVSSRSLQQSRRVSELLAPAALVEPLKALTVLPADDRIVPLYLDLMQQYNLLPNDALIIATAKLHQIPAVASFDADFVAACAGEGIRLVRDVADLA